MSTHYTPHSTPLHHLSTPLSLHFTTSPLHSHSSLPPLHSTLNLPLHSPPQLHFSLLLRYTPLLHHSPSLPLHSTFHFPSSQLDSTQIEHSLPLNSTPLRSTLVQHNSLTTRFHSDRALDYHFPPYSNVGRKGGIALHYHSPPLDTTAEESYLSDRAPLPSSLTQRQAGREPILRSGLDRALPCLLKLLNFSHVNRKGKGTRHTDGRRAG